MKVGFIGLGRMGQGMAGRILAAGHDLLVSDPTPGQTTSLEEQPALWPSTHRLPQHRIETSLFPCCPATVF